MTLFNAASFSARLGTHPSTKRGLTVLYIEINVRILLNRFDKLSIQNNIYLIIQCITLYELNTSVIFIAIETDITHTNLCSLQ